MRNIAIMFFEKCKLRCCCCLMSRGIIADRSGQVEPVPPFAFWLWFQPPITDVKPDTHILLFFLQKTHRVYWQTAVNYILGGFINEEIQQQWNRANISEAVSIDIYTSKVWSGWKYNATFFGSVKWLYIAGIWQQTSGCAETENKLEWSSRGNICTVNRHGATACRTRWTKQTCFIQ